MIAEPLATGWNELKGVNVSKCVMQFNGRCLVDVRMMSKLLMLECPVMSNQYK